MTSRSTSQVGGWQPLLSAHLVRPACTAAFSSRRLFLTDVSVVGESSHNSPGTVLPLLAAFLFACFLRSTKWSGCSAVRARLFTLAFLTCNEGNHTHQSTSVTAMQAVPLLVLSVHALYRKKEESTVPT